MATTRSANVSLELRLTQSPTSVQYAGGEGGGGGGGGAGAHLSKGAHTATVAALLLVSGPNTPTIRSGNKSRSDTSTPIRKVPRSNCPLIAGLLPSWTCPPSLLAVVVCSKLSCPPEGPPVGFGGLPKGFEAPSWGWGAASWPHPHPRQHLPSNTAYTDRQSRRSRLSFPMLLR